MTADLAERSRITAFTLIVINVSLYADAVTVLPYLHRQAHNI